ncbi:MAG TPA: 2,3-bisphosphoglycerate-dependent phosphoglycerate mutase [Rhodospirillaceae bacterium]|jgi:2,3-bisphosphoglycerate-dependent phosphoglycerate mutase|nr:2,3-bisphosphoglycerate-dependent phosphoglycerate mutase [Alphaproteobacteria bacterium]HBH26422.1 2,3-bisphosphoglycerate-dependent phosphoglycerate mutase [Rhodospirillaceae bacterium]
MTAKTLILLRHGQSRWNLQNRFTGFHDAGLSDQGVAEARAVGRVLKTMGLAPQAVLTSTQKRAHDTACLALTEMGQEALIPAIRRFDALRERDYGDLTGMDKDAARKAFGAEQVQVWRRSYDVAPPEGESLQDVVEGRVRPWAGEVLPTLPGVTLIAAHGNSLRALLIVLGAETPQTINAAEIPTGGGVILELAGGKIAARRVLEHTPAE